MKQRPLPTTPPGIHTAIIMDGNGRWASTRGLPRPAGHRAGAGVVRKIVEAAPNEGVGILTLYAFSSDNWNRPRSEVDGLMRLFRLHLLRETERCIANDVRLTIIGRRDRIDDALRGAIDGAEAATAGGRTLWLRIALDYSARDRILRAAEAARDVPGPLTCAAFASCIAGTHGDAPAPDVDLLIRTGGERRLSDFLLWECAYAELYFTSRFWPDFTAADLREAITDFRARDRRFGGLPRAAAI